ncbi:MAG: glycosyltransferase family 2 protein [Phaeodactylibacter sp.]|nr:glycosyltransferase family 2 protein [Phaeodactylibacter sp.]MCB9301690.1 glycosyltransferase family 2 protein [Lewinellaceae bacterium]
MQQEPISILIPAYNREKFLGECLESIFKQTYPNIRAVVYDDGSEDGTVEVARAFPLYQIIEGATNRGVSYARNRLLEACDTRYAAWQDSDDVSNVFRIAEQYGMIIRSGAPIVYCYHRREGAQISAQWARQPEAPLRASGLSLGGSLFNAEKGRAIPFDESINLGGEDLIWRMAVEKRFGAPAVVRKVLYYIRQHPNRIGRIKTLPENRKKKSENDLAYAAALQLLNSK